MSGAGTRPYPLTVEDLWRHVPEYQAGLGGDDKAKATVRRMFERDKDDLPTLGTRVEADSYSINYGLEKLKGYRLAAHDFHLPYLSLAAEVTGHGPFRSTPGYQPPICSIVARTPS